MSQAKELLGKVVYYIDKAYRPFYAQIVAIQEGGYVSLMIPLPQAGTVEFKRQISHCWTVVPYHWVEIEAYEDWELMQKGEFPDV